MVSCRPRVARVDGIAGEGEGGGRCGRGTAVCAWPRSPSHRPSLVCVLRCVLPAQTVIVIGDLYRGRRALRGWARTPVLKVILEFLASQRRVVLVVSVWVGAAGAGW